MYTVHVKYYLCDITCWFLDSGFWSLNKNWKSTILVSKLQSNTVLYVACNDLKLGILTMAYCVDGLTFGVSHKWPLHKLHIYVGLALEFSWKWKMHWFLHNTFLLKHFVQHVSFTLSDTHFLPVSSFYLTFTLMKASAPPWGCFDRGSKNVVDSAGAGTSINSDCFMDISIIIYKTPVTYFVVWIVSLPDKQNLTLKSKHSLSVCNGPEHISPKWWCSFCEPAGG